MKNYSADTSPSAFLTRRTVLASSAASSTISTFTALAKSVTVSFLAAKIASAIAEA